MWCLVMAWAAYLNTCPQWAAYMPAEGPVELLGVWVAALL